MLNINVVDCRKVIGESKLKALVDVKFTGGKDDEGIIIKGFNVIMGKQGVFIAMPRKPSRDGRWYDTVTPTSEAVKTAIENKVLEAYDKESDI